MNPVDRTLADYQGTGMTVGPHIVRHLRDNLTHAGVVRAIDLKQARNGSWVKIAGLVIVRQRPGTAKGMCFITLEDETGTANAAVRPDVFEVYRTVIHTATLLLVEGPLQKVRTGAGWQVSGAGTASSPDSQHPTPDPQCVIHVLARRLRPLELPHHPVGLTGRGYRMRVTPGDTPGDEQPPVADLPKSWSCPGFVDTPNRTKVR